MKPSLFEMFVSFLKIGTLLLGGGYVIVPLLNNELSYKKGWVTKEEIIDFYALGQCVPGIIAANTTLFIGYKLRGKAGALAAFFGLILPPFFAIIFLAAFLGAVAENVIMNDVFWGVNVAIIILLFLTVKEVWAKSIVDKFTFFIFVLILALMLFGLSPSVAIVLSAVLGIVYKVLEAKMLDKEGCKTSNGVVVEDVFDNTKAGEDSAR